MSLVDRQSGEPLAGIVQVLSLFAHTSPIYVKLKARGVFDAQTATGLGAQMKSDWEKIRAQAVFDDASQSERVSQLYQQAIAVIEWQLADQGK